MKRVILVCGLISGGIVTLMMLFTLIYCYNSGNFDGSVYLGYAGMLLAFSLIFVGIRSYRDKYNNGSISFGKAFKIGFMIALIASTMYVGVWLIEYYFFFPDFMEKYSAHEISKMKADGASAAAIAKQTADLQQMMTWYKSPIGIILLTYMEILPLGTVAALVCALILKRKTSKLEPVMA